MKTSWRIMVGVLVVLIVVCGAVAWAAEAPAAAKEAPKPAAQAPAKEAPKQAAQAQAAAEAPAALPPGEATLGVHFLDQDAETFGDVILPVYQFGDGLLFVNPRGTINDSDGQEGNIGVGYRQLFPDKNFIVGANAYYDVRDTELDNTFDQFGFGLEFLSQWVDARVNYYLPEDDIKEGDIHLQRTDMVREITQRWDKPVGNGNIIEQSGWTADSTYEVTSLQHFRIYEEALEGFDAEVGALLPIPVVQDYADVKVFVGWYDFESDLGGDLEGAKARVEVRALPSLYLDGSWYEDENLYGSHYSVGARASVPFDLAKLSAGKNPFAGALDGFKPSREKAPFASRLTEMVIRDLHVRTGASEPEEIVEDRRILSKNLVSRTKKGKYHVLETDVIFVDKDNDEYGDGSWENPYHSIQVGVDDPRGRMVYVLDAREQYYENVIMRQGMVLWGNGCPYYGAGGQFLGNGVFPVVNGQNLRPAIELKSGVELAGFEIYQPGGYLNGTTQDEKFPSQVAPGIYGYDVTDVNIHCNYVHGDAMLDDIEPEAKGSLWASGIQINGYGMDYFSAAIWNNRVENFFGNGIGLNLDNVGSVDVLLANNEAEGNVGHGLAVEVYGPEAETYDVENGVPYGMFLARVSGEYSRNGNDGVWLSARGFDAAVALFVDTVADENRNTGLAVDLQADEMAGALFASHVDLDRLDQLLNTVMGGLNLFPAISEEDGSVSVADMLGLGELYREDARMQANGNYNGGVWLGQGSDANLAAFVGMQANGNGDYNWMDEGGKQGGWGGYNINQYMNEGPEPLADGWGVSVLAMIRCEANDNAPGPGINVSSDGHELSLGVFMDVAANRNYECGLKGTFHSEYGVAGALVMSSDPMFGLIENLTASPLLGEFVEPMDMGFIPPYGQVQMNDNGGSGINIEADGYDAAFAVILDTQANGNGNYYDATDKVSTMHAGIQLDLASEDGMAIGVVASTEALMGMAQEVVDEMEVPVDLTGVSTLGPVQVNGNAGAGLYINANAEEEVIVGVLGVEALGNGWSMGPVGKNGYYGDGINIMANSQYGDAMVGLAYVNASWNDGVGIHVDANAQGEYGEAMIGGIMITANENQYDGLQLSANSGSYNSSYLVLAGVQANDNVLGSGIYGSVMGMGTTAAALQDIEANGNGQKGVWLDVDSYNGDAHVWVGEGATAAMNDHMGDWDWDLFDEIVPMLPEGDVYAMGNAEAGVRIEADAMGGNVLVGVRDLEASGNGVDLEEDNHAGLAILANAYGEEDDGNVDISVEDALLTDNTGNGLRIRSWADSELSVNVSGVTATGNENSGAKVVMDGWIVDADFTDNVLSGNGRDGLLINLYADFEGRLFGEYNVMRDNGDDGLDVSTTAPTRYYDFGGGVYGSLGMNSMSGNGDYEVERNGKGPFYIMNSYWGGAAPVAGVDYTGNNMQVGGWLAVDPNP